MGTSNRLNVSLTGNAWEALMSAAQDKGNLWEVSLHREVSRIQSLDQRLRKLGEASLTERRNLAEEIAEIATSLAACAKEMRVSIDAHLELSNIQ